MSKRWRMLRMGDNAAVERMHSEQHELIKMPVDKPDLFGKPVLLALVLEKNGEATGGFYFEAVGELCFLGIDPEVTARAPEIAPQLFSFLRKRGIRWLRCFPPKSMEEVLGPQLERSGFVKQDNELCHYAVDLRDKGVADGA